MRTGKNELFAFIVMPFASEFTPVYEAIVKTAVELCGIRCIRADEESQGHIHHQMFQRIYESAVVIADVTGLNPNVFYELGVAHSSGCKTIVICESGSLDKLPFDISPYRVFSYDAPNKYTAESLEKLTQSLAEEIAKVIADDSEGIPNPVQDYLASQSPVRSGSSLFLNELGSKEEEELFKSAKKEIRFYGITANSFSDLLTGIIESRNRNSSIDIQLMLLDPEARDCWDFVYRMREGGPIEPTQLQENYEDDVHAQKRAVRRLESLTRLNGVSVSVHYYSDPPVFWAYRIDRERLIVGHLAMHRWNARNLPVNILVRKDRSTQNLYTYYDGIVEPG